MTLPAAPPITLGQVYAEFGAPAGTPLGSFLRGGGYVPNVPQNYGVPTSLPISMGQLCGSTRYAQGSLQVGSASDTTDLTGRTAPTAVPVSAYPSVTVTGGTGNYTYQWQYIGGSTLISCNDPNGKQPLFSATLVRNSSAIGVWRLTVNDGVTSLTGDCNVNLRYVWSL